MTSQQPIQEHSLFKHFVQLGEKLYLNVNLPGNTDRTVLPIVTSWLASIYLAAGRLPAAGSAFASRDDKRAFTLTSHSYSVFVEGNVLITANIKELSNYTGS